MSEAKQPQNLDGPNVYGMVPEAAVAALIDHAVKLPASDLYIGANENHVAVSVRHLGIVRLLTILSPDLGRRCISYIKAMAAMDLAETRRPLDGRWVRQARGRQPGRPADQHHPHPLRRGHDAPPAGLPVAGAGARPARHEPPEPERPAVDAQLHQRPDPGHRPDRLGQDDDALRLPALPERRPAQDQHDRGPDRVRRRRPAAVAGQPQGRRRLPRAAAEHPPADPRRDHDRRDPRPGDRRDRRARRQQRPARAGDAARPDRRRRRAERCSAWAPIPTSSPTRSWA